MEERTLRRRREALPSDEKFDLDQIDFGYSQKFKKVGKGDSNLLFLRRKTIGEF